MLYIMLISIQYKAQSCKLVNLTCKQVSIFIQNGKANIVYLAKILVLLTYFNEIALPISQNLPSQGSEHLHRKSSLLSAIQVPPFLHGLLVQASISGHHIDTVSQTYDHRYLQNYRYTEVISCTHWECRDIGIF